MKYIQYKNIIKSPNTCSLHWWHFTHEGGNGRATNCLPKGGLIFLNSVTTSKCFILPFASGSYSLHNLERNVSCYCYFININNLYLAPVNAYKDIHCLAHTTHTRTDEKKTDVSKRCTVQLKVVKWHHDGTSQLIFSGYPVGDYAPF